MLAKVSAIIVACASIKLVSALEVEVEFKNPAPMTPHEQFSSSAGVLGCKINTNRVAYWPGLVDCNNICIEIHGPAKSLTLLRIDSSGGAYDISYDAWNELVYGESAKVNPQAGGPVEMTWEDVPFERCLDLLKTSDGTLAFSAPTGSNLPAHCLETQPGSVVATHYSLININDAQCHAGQDEECMYSPATRLLTCPSPAGYVLTDPGLPVYNIKYPTGEEYKA